jgi:hypothetical protein
MSAAGCAGGGSSGGSNVVPLSNAATAAPNSVVGSTRTVQDATGVLQDGGFEDGYTYWSQCGSGASASEQTSVVHSGTHAAKMGGTTTVPDGDAALCQSFTIPTTNPTITFWIQESTNQTSTTNDYQAGQLTAADGTVRKNLYKEANTTSGWVQRTYSLSTYAGQTVVLKFVVHGNGASGANMVQYIDDITIGGSGGTPTPSPSPTPTHTPSPTPTHSASPSPTPGGNPCLQSQGTGQSSSVSIVPYTTVMSAISGGHSICFSAYVFTTASFDALDAAAKAGATETVVLPHEEQTTDQTDATTLTTDGATIVWDSGTSPTHPLHAKLAIVDGVAYLDGRNWDTTDVTITDGNSSDFTAIENALNLNPTSSTNLDTLKSNSVTREANLITGGSYSSSVTLRYMSESFGTDTAMNSALEAAALAGANVEIIVLKSDETGNATEQGVLTTLKGDGASVRLNGAGGSEKMTLISNKTSGWFGSANSTKYSANSDNYIDWGMTVTASGVLSSLQSYFDSTWSSSTPY